MDWNPLHWASNAINAVTAPAQAILHTAFGQAAQTGLEHIASGAHWLYSNAVARPVSTAEQVFSNTGLGTLGPGNWANMAQSALTGHNPFNQVHLDQFKTVGQGDTWANAYKRSAYISPGQASAISLAGGPSNLPLNMDDPNSVRNFFSSGPQKYFSGAADFTLNWVGDPLVVGGKAVKVLKGADELEKLLSKNTSALVKATGQNRLANPAEQSLAAQQTYGQAADKGGLFDRISNSITGKSANQIMQYNFARQGTNGPLLAHLLSTAESKAQQAQLFRLSLGDHSAYLELERSNKELANQVNYATDRWSSLSNNVDRLTPGTPAMDIAKSRMDDYQKQLGDLDQRYSIIKAKMDVYNTQDTLHYGMGSDFAAHARGVRHDVIQPSIFDRPLMIARSLSEKTPRGWVDLNDPNSIKEVEAQLEHAGKSITPQARDKMLSDYAAAPDKVSRQRTIAGIEKTVADTIAKAHGFNMDEGNKIYASWAAKRGQVLDNSNRMSAARYTDETGQSVPVDQFTDDSGAMMIAPPLRSQLQRSHVFLDMDQYNQALRLHGDGLKAVMRAGFGTAHTAAAMATTFQSYWKLGVFARLGFPMRNVSDDLLSQTARFGVASMLGRMTDGGKNLIRGNIQRSGKLLHSSLDEAAQAHVADVAESAGLIQKDLERLMRSGNPETDPILRDKIQTVHVQHDLAVQTLKQAQAKAAEVPVYKAGMQGFNVHGVEVPAAFAGDEGQMFQKLVSSAENQYNMLGIASEETHKLLRASHWEILSPGVDESRHLDGWLHVAQNQMGTDALARKVLAGDSRKDVQKWLIATPEGRSYYQDLGLKHVRSGDLFDRVKAEADQYFPPEYPGLRDAILDGSISRDMLKDAMPAQYRPDIHTGRTDFNMGKGFLAHKADKYVEGFYKWFATMPQDMMSRNPLFAQQYQAHAQRIIQKMTSQGQEKFLPSEIDTIANRARQFAKRDTLRYSADMMHKSNAAQGLRVVSPFFNATEEAFSRWGRVIGENPQTLGYMAKTFQAPAQMGLVVDQNGNKVGADGYAVDTAGKRYLVPQSQRTLLIGKHLAPWLKGNQKIAIGQESLDFIFPGQPAGNPGVGPLVQVGANQILKDKPGAADVAQQLGILPYGTNSKGVLGNLLPPSVKKLSDYLYSDESDQDYQRIYLGILQSEYTKHQMGWRPTAADQNEIKNRTRQHFGLAALAGLGLPFTASTQPGNQYLINEYQRMQATDPVHADANFYNKYGDAAFAFTAHLSKTNAAVPTTKEGFAAFQKYRSLIQVDPELAGMIIGQDGKGDFSTNAYQAELATAIGGPYAQKIRQKQSPADAIADANRRKGWVQFNKYMTQLKTQLTARGLTDFKQAPDLNSMKGALVKVLSTPDSPYYNKEWSKDYFTFDTTKYNRIIPAMTQIANDPLIKDRGDMVQLRAYLTARKDVVSVLAQRAGQGGSKTLDAHSNSDLKGAWDLYVGHLMEQNLDFEALHNRYLNKDLGTKLPATATTTAPPGG